MKTRTVLSFVSAGFYATLASLATAASLVSVASAQYATGFENPPFVSGDVHGQDAWTTSANTATARVRTASEIATDLTPEGAGKIGSTSSSSGSLPIGLPVMVGGPTNSACCFRRPPTCSWKRSGGSVYAAVNSAAHK